MSKVITVHIVNTLPLHNLNRDQNGLPKSQMDGGVQRARLSAQSLKRAARSSYRGQHTGTSMRTRDALELVLDQAATYAQSNGLIFDEVAAGKATKKVLDGLTTSEENTKQKAEKALEDAKTKARKDATKQAKGAQATPEEAEVLVTQAITEAEKQARAAEREKKTILFLAEAELATLARAIVDKQQGGEEPKVDDMIGDATSPSLDIAAFGRMFANQTDVSTHAAIAVSHAATTHQMALTTDYFSAVEDGEQSHSGAAHIGMNYYTTGVYYRSFTIDVEQLRRSWSAIDAPGARQDLADLVRCLIEALPTGKLNNTNAHTAPTVVLAELQRSRIAYEFDTPVPVGTDGGYKEQTVRGLAAKRSQAVSFDPDNFDRAVVAGESFDADFHAEIVPTVTGIVDFIVESVYETADHQVDGVFA